MGTVMNTFRTKKWNLFLLAAAAIVLAAPLSYASAQEAAAEASSMPSFAANGNDNQSVKVTAQGNDIIVKFYGNDVYRGYGEFKASGEHLYACDKKGDGKTVTTWLFWNGEWRGSVSDHTGVKDGCGHKNLSIKEGTSVWLSVCLEGFGCSYPVWGKA
ncbi:hypothetical protein NTE_00999 [Candidatus Nitrososphaera evergladensis SR1]|uniref:Uncharacterized protein n=1 Tax=Candidatus Nitrososphaera evergladensis SR1 TaxID=1459636 RepID=A0A075MPD1_9ARCH|nr:hypothetical protein [Candidatus Nitrososphaera evergladensis]AIF83073.1 hypothetical protein NTE_00999 [Candidatus Nitrososphaera evergladensis SR1]